MSEKTKKIVKKIEEAFEVEHRTRLVEYWTIDKYGMRKYARLVTNDMQSNFLNGSSKNCFFFVALQSKNPHLQLVNYGFRFCVPQKI